MLATLNPSVLPALRIAGALFLIFNLVVGVYIWRHRRQFFGWDSIVTGDRSATRQLQVMALCIPYLFLTYRLLYVWVATWID